VVVQEITFSGIDTLGRVMAEEAGILWGSFALLKRLRNIIVDFAGAYGEINILQTVSAHLSQVRYLLLTWVSELVTDERLTMLFKRPSSHLLFEPPPPLHHN